MIFDLQALPEIVGDSLYTSPQIGGLIISAVAVLFYTLVLVAIMGKFDIKISDFSIFIAILYYPPLGVLVFLGWLPIWTLIFITFILVILIGRENDLWRQ